MHNFISMAKNHLITASEYAEDRAAIERDRSARMPAIHMIYKAYEARCRQANAMDFDDILLYTFLLFRDNKEIREKYGQQFEYILVDEYQDTNYAQVSIISQLAETLVVSVLWVMTIRVSILSVVQTLTISLTSSISLTMLNSLS